MNSYGFLPTELSKKILEYYYHIQTEQMSSWFKLYTFDSLQGLKVQAFIKDIYNLS